MAVTFYTQQPDALLKEFKEKITQEEAEGSISTWEINHQGYFTHKGRQYAHDAYFSAKSFSKEGKLVFNIIRPAGKSIGIRVYGYYHGHLTETFLNHFDKMFDTAASSALPVQGDNVTEPKK